MKNTITIKELYADVRDGRIVSDIELQREIIYDDDKQRLVIDSIANDIPLPAFYLWKNKNGILEVLDGKQRIHAITRFIENDLQYDNLLWKELNSKRPELQEKINNTKLSIIICEGEEEHKREIFSRINTLGVPLSQYEVLNGLYAGEYLRGLSKFVEADKDARKVLGSNSRGKNQMKVLDFICSLKHVKDKKEYVKQQADLPFEDDQILVTKHFRFVAAVFDDYGSLPMLLRLAVKYKKDISIWKSYKAEINKRLKAFRKSQDYKLVVNKEKETEDIIQAIVNGISVDPKRLFTRDDKKILCDEAFNDPERHDGKGKILCSGGCKQYFFPEELTVDHKRPWSLGGRTNISNAELLCRACNSKKGNN